MVLKDPKGAPQSGLTLADVAREAGVSEITVSRVIRSKGPIADETRRRVQAAVQAIGYVPNRVAGSLAAQSSDLIGVVLPSLSNIVFLDVLRGLAEATSKHGYRPVVSVTEYDLGAERDLVRSLLSWRPAALILTGCHHDAETKRMLRGAGITIVEIMDIEGDPADIVIGMSHQDAAREMAIHLVRRGYRRFGYVGPDLSLDLRANKRRAAFIAAIAEAGASFLGEVAMAGQSSVPAGREGLAQLLDAHPSIDAVYFSNDDMAMGGIFHCMAEAIAIPGRLAVAGFNGLDLGQTLPQPLTTTLTRRFDMGFKAGLAILGRLGGAEVRASTDVGFELLIGATA